MLQEDNAPNIFLQRINDKKLNFLKSPASQGSNRPFLCDTIAGSIMKEEPKIQIIMVRCISLSVRSLVKPIYHSYQNLSSENAHRAPQPSYRMRRWGLAPLRRVDVIEAARAKGLDANEFLREIDLVEAVPLAIKPITLKFLLILSPINAY